MHFLCLLMKTLDPVFSKCIEHSLPENLNETSDYLGELKANTRSVSSSLGHTDRSSQTARDATAVRVS